MIENPAINSKNGSLIPEIIPVTRPERKIATTIRAKVSCASSPKMRAEAHKEIVNRKAIPKFILRSAVLAIEHSHPYCVFFFKGGSIHLGHNNPSSYGKH